MSSAKPFDIVIFLITIFTYAVSQALACLAEAGEVLADGMSKNSPK